MKKWAFCILLGVIPVYADSVQERWVARYNGSAVQQNDYDYVKAMVLDDYGNIYVTGGSWVDGQGYDLTTIKYNIDGNQIWLKKYDGPRHDNDIGVSIGIDSHGDIYVTGKSYGNGTSLDYVTLKHNGQTGENLWVRRYDKQGQDPEDNWDYAYDLVVDHQDNVYVTGYVDANKGCTTIKYSRDGDMKWVKAYSSSGNYCFSNAIAVDHSGNIFVTGRYYIDNINRWDIFVVKYNPDGIELWNATYDDPGGEGNENIAPGSWDEGLDVVTDSAGNVYVTGRIFQSDTEQDSITLKYLANGDPNWMSVYKSTVDSGKAKTVAIVLDSQENVIVTGTGTASNGEKNFLTIKYKNRDGALLWYKNYNSPKDLDAEAMDVDMDACDNVYVTGYADFGTSPHKDSITIKYSALGDKQWIAQYNGTGGMDDGGKQVAWHKSGYVYTIHKSVGYGTYDDYVTIQYDQNFQIQLQAPLGGEVLLAGDNFNIEWDADTSIGTVDIEFSEDNGDFWTSIVQDCAYNASPYVWNVPYVDSEECLIRIKQSSNPCLFDVSALFTVKKILLTFPNGGEAFKVGDSNEITWRWNCQTTDSVNITLSRDGGQNWEQVFASQGNLHRYSPWLITEPSSNQCIVRVEDTNDPSTFDNSDDVFAIYNVHLLAPNGGEQLIANQLYQIQWESDDPSKTVKLEFSSNAEGQWETVAEQTANLGQYAWNIPDVSSDACFVRISYTEDTLKQDDSDAAFSIRQYQTYPPDPNEYQLLPANPNDYYWIALESNKWEYIPGDYNDDGYQTITDLSLLSSAWLQEAGFPGYNPRMDLDNNLAIGLEELIQFAETWLLCAHPYDPVCYRQLWPSCWCRPYQCMGDINEDGLIDGNDESVLLTHMNTKYLESDYWACADFNRDGLIDYRDQEIYDVFSQVDLSGLTNTCRCGGWWPPHVRWYVEQNREEEQF